MAIRPMSGKLKKRRVSHIGLVNRAKAIKPITPAETSPQPTCLAWTFALPSKYNEFL